MEKRQLSNTSASRIVDDYQDAAAPGTDFKGLALLVGVMTGAGAFIALFLWASPTLRPYAAWILGAIAVCVVGLIGYRIHREEDRKDTQAQTFRPTANNMLPAYLDKKKGTFIQGRDGALPSPAYHTYSPAIHSHNDVAQLQKLLALRTMVEEEPQGQLAGALPDYVLYEDIRPDIPRRHALVGVDAQGIVSRKREDIKSLIWIVGASGTGKTRSVCIRVEEDYEYGHFFYLIDPHFFKPDSLWNALKDTAYAHRLILPMAYDTDDIIATLDAFLEEFHRRKRGGQWNHPVTIIIDEVGSLTADKPASPAEKAMQEKVKQIARVCGQEARGFDMAGIFISQDATGLSWLRNRAHFVIAHQLNMMAERILACNDDRTAARAMDTWPRGRTYVYGIGLTSGPQLVQQPYYEPPIIDSTLVEMPDFQDADTEELMKDTDEPTIPAKEKPRRAALADALEIWDDLGEIGRPRLREELIVRGMECSDDWAKQLLKNIKHRRQVAGGGGGGAQF